MSGNPPRNRTPGPEHECTAFALLAAEVDALPSHGVTRDQVRRLVLRFAGERIYIPKAAGKAQRQAAAARMLASGTPRALIVQALVDTYGMGRTQAYATVNAALQARRPGQTHPATENGRTR